MSLKSMEGAIFVQPGGPNTDVRYLGSCHRITGVSWNRGTNTLHHCGDPVQPNQFRVTDKTKGPPGLVTYNIESQVQALISYIEELNCPVPVLITSTNKAPKNDDTNWDRAWLLPNSDNVQRDWSDLVGMDENSLVMRTTGMEADAVIELVRLKVFRDSDISETEALNHIFACDFDICASETSPRGDRCDTLYAVGDAVSGSAVGTASVWKFSNGNWAALAADPFGADENIATGTCFILDRETTRILVFRGTTDAGNPAEAAYSDDNGVTWSNANIGSVNGEFVAGPHSLAALDRNHIWVGTNLGRIYFSANGGESWEIQENAQIHISGWNWIEMLDSSNGFAGGTNDVVAVTGDGGETWSQVNAPGNGGDILCGAVVDPLRAWVGTDDGDLFYTFDAGATWFPRGNWAGSGTGAVKSIRFFGDQVGFMVHEDGTGKARFFMSKSGGANWETIVTPTNSGVNSMLLCSPRLLWAVGEAHGGRATVYKVNPQQAT